jgi:hypothetical protein
MGLGVAIAHPGNVGTIHQMPGHLSTVRDARAGWGCALVYITYLYHPAALTDLAVYELLMTFVGRTWCRFEMVDVDGLRCSWLPNWLCMCFVSWAVTARCRTLI